MVEGDCKFPCTLERWDGSLMMEQKQKKSQKIVNEQKEKKNKLERTIVRPGQQSEYQNLLR